MIKSLLPPNATAQERAIEQSMRSQINLDVEVIRTLWDPYNCPLALLPWLAWAFSVDAWDNDWSEEQKRAVVASAVEVHQHKGTAHAIKTVVASTYNNAELQEWFEYGGDPYTFRVTTVLNNNEAIDYDKAADAVKYINAAKNARSKLESMRLMLQSPTQIYTAGHMSIGKRITVEPYIPTDLPVSKTITAFGFVNILQTIRPKPISEEPAVSTFKAVEFGANTSVEFNSILDGEEDAATYEIWATIQSYAYNQYLLQNEGYFILRAFGGYVSLYYWYTGAGNFATIDWLIPIDSAGRPMHFVVTYKKNEYIKLFINGIEAQLKNGSNGYNMQPVNFYAANKTTISRQGIPISEGDEVMEATIYAKDLAPEDILSIYNEGNVIMPDRRGPGLDDYIHAITAKNAMSKDLATGQDTTIVGSIAEGSAYTEVGAQELPVEDIPQMGLLAWIDGETGATNKVESGIAVTDFGTTEGAINELAAFGVNSGAHLMIGLSAINRPASFTTFAVARMDSATSLNVLHAACSSNGADKTIWGAAIYGIDSANKYSCYHSSSTDTLAAKTHHTSTIAAGRVFLLSQRYTAGDDFVEIFIDGSEEVVTKAGALLTANNGASHDMAIGKLGEYTNGSSFNFTGDVGEFAIYNRAITDAEMTNINNYLISKYGI